MARTNTRTKTAPLKTHEGAPARRANPLQALRRSVASCLLWEKEFYEDGEAIADRIVKLADEIKPADLANLAVEVRSSFNLRHVPLLLLTVLAKTGSGRDTLVSDAIESVVQRADELGELVSLYWRKGKSPLSAQMKKGLARALRKFDEYQLAKWNKDGAVKIRDVLFLTHAKPKDKAQGRLWKRLAEDTLKTPDTWEVALSGGADKRKTFERLIEEGNLGYLALLRNLRNMAQAGVDTDAVNKAILARKNGADRVLPFRFIAAARACPQFEPALDKALIAGLKGMKPLPGKTAVLVDVSGSMDARLSAKSDLNRIDAAAALASIIPGDVRIFSFSDRLVEVPARQGMAGVDAIISSQAHHGTRLGAAVREVGEKMKYDRLIVITDEQSHDPVGGPKGRGYMINVASNKNGVGYGPWVHIDGFSESVLRFIAEYEAASAFD